MNHISEYLIRSSDGVSRAKFAAYNSTATEQI